MGPDELIRELQAVGYAVQTDGTGIHLTWMKECDPPSDIVRPLLILLKKHKEAVIQYLEQEVTPFPAEWLERYDDEILERLSIMTVDGGLTDEEALEVLRS